jgi:hypothetical protein
MQNEIYLIRLQQYVDTNSEILQLLGTTTFLKWKRLFSSCHFILK